MLLAGLVLLAACHASQAGIESGLAPFHERARCLSADGAPGAGLLAAPAACAAPRWRIEMNGADGARGLYRIVSLSNGLCMEAPAALSARVRLEPCALMSSSQRIMIDGFERAPSSGEFDLVHTSAAVDLARYKGLILHAAGGCLGIEPDGAVTLQPCVEPATGRFNPFTEWSLSPRPDVE